ncbi:hypothetical protein D9M69_358030 [compost metagenome]
MLVDVGGVDVGQAEGAGVGHVLQGADVHLGLGLGAVVGFQPHQVAAPAFLAAEAQHGGLVEVLARRQVVAAATVELAVGEAVAEVQGVAVDQETVADHDVLAAEGEVHAVLAEGFDQVAGAPAEVGVLDLGGALGAVGEAGGVAVAPGAGAEQGEGAVAGAGAAEALVEAQAVLDVALAPGRRPLAEGAAHGVVLLAVEDAEHGFEVGVQVAVVIGIQLVGAGLRGGADQQREGGEAEYGRLVHGLASLVIGIG